MLESFRISWCSLTVIPVAAVAHMYAITKVLYDKTRLLLWITQVPLEMCADRERVPSFSSQILASNSSIILRGLPIENHRRKHSGLFLTIANIKNP